MRTIILTVFALICISGKGSGEELKSFPIQNVLTTIKTDNNRNTSFPSFLSRYFRPWKQTKASKQIFGGATIKDLIDEDLYTVYLPSSDLSTCKGEMRWKGGCYVQHKGFVIAFLRHICMDGGHKILMEDIVDNLMMVIYSKDGNVIDKRVIGKKAFLILLV